MIYADLWLAPGLTLYTPALAACFVVTNCCLSHQVDFDVTSPACY
jgi:hypothetical protein